MSNENEGHSKILARVIIEMLGAPKEHIEKTLKDYVKKLKQDDKLEIVKQDLAPATEQDKLFSAFAELDIRFANPNKLIDFCFDSMPSSVEIIEPESITIGSASLSSALNDLQAKLHHSDMIIKTLKAKGALLDKNAKSVLTNFVYFMLRDGPKEIEQLSENMGINPKHLKPFLDELMKNKKISEKEGKYERVK